MNTCEWYVELEPSAATDSKSTAMRIGPLGSEQLCQALVHQLKTLNLFSERIFAVHQRRKRRESRIKVELPVELSYRNSADTDSTSTLDISESGARLKIGKKSYRPGDILDISYRGRAAPFRVIWVGKLDSLAAGQFGVECVAPEENIWGLEFAETTDYDADMGTAHAVQSRLYPQTFPELATLEYAADCVQARVVGGDYYDVIDLGTGNVAFVVADVSGKGIPAALLMATLHATVRSSFDRGLRNIASGLAAVNKHFYAHTDAIQYATLFLAWYHDRERMLRYANCGHNPALLVRHDDSVERLEPTATVLGLFPDWSCSIAETYLMPGDLMCAYTDGITECTNQAGDQFGEARLLDVLQHHKLCSPQEILHALQRVLRGFRAGEQNDDMTVLVAHAR